MVKILRDRRSGEFRGSIGDGKNRVPSPRPTPRTVASLSSTISPEQRVRDNRDIEEIAEAFRAAKLSGESPSSVLNRLSPSARRAADAEIARRVKINQDAAEMTKKSSITVEEASKIMAKPKKKTKPGPPKISKYILEAERRKRETANDLMDAYLPQANDPAITEETAMRLTYNSFPLVRNALAANPYAPPMALIKLASDSDPRIRKEVARNPAVPLDCVNVLSNDPHPEVINALRNNRNLRARWISWTR